MVTPRFLQIHTLHSYPAALLNRDDSGLAKRMPFGDAVRTRISSQCLKRHWRSTQDEFALSAIAPDAIRSRNVVDREVIEPLEKAGEFSNEVLTAVQNAFNSGVYGSKRHIGSRAPAPATRLARSGILAGKGCRHLC